MRKRAFLLCLLPATLHAQTPAATTDATTQAGAGTEQVVVTATRTPVPASEISAGVTVIDRATIEARGYTDLVQALSAVPGVRVAQSGGPGSLASVFIRGTNSNQVLVLRDGVPVNDPGDPGDDPGVLDPEHRFDHLGGPRHRHRHPSDQPPAGRANGAVQPSTIWRTSAVIVQYASWTWRKRLVHSRASALSRAWRSA